MTKYSIDNTVTKLYADIQLLNTFASHFWGEFIAL